MASEKKINALKILPYTISICCLVLFDIILLIGIFDNSLRGLMLSSQIILPGVAVAGLSAMVLNPTLYGKIQLLLSKSINKDIPAESEVTNPKKLERATVIQLFITIFLLFINTKMIYQISDLPRTSGDTIDFILGSAYHPLSLEFWTAYKPPLLPLLIRILGYTNAEIFRHELLDDIANIQLIISAAAWSIFALSVSFHLKKRESKLLAFAVILFFSATLDISLWDRLTLSESLSISFFALWMAASSSLLYILYKPIKSVVVRISFLVVFTVITFLYANARDTNIYFVVLIEGLLLLWFTILRQNYMLRQKLFIVVALVVAALFILHSYVYDVSNRWHPVIMDIMTDRLSNDPDAISFFVDEGMPPVEDILANHAYPDFHSFLDSRRFQVLGGTGADVFNTWFADYSKKTYISYLLHNPINTLTEPLKNWKKMILENNYEYREPNGTLSRRIQWLTKLLYPYNQIVLLGLFSAVIGFFAFSFRTNQVINPLWFLVSGLLLTMPLLMILIWVGGSLEVPRHAFQISMQFRLALWMGLILGVDLLPSGRKIPGAQES